MSSKVLVFGFASVLVGAAATRSHADGPAPGGDVAATAKDHYDRAMVAYNVQDWPTAIRELKAAYEGEPKQEYVFALGQAQRLSGDCAGALMSFHAFMREATPKQIEAVQALAKECEAKVDQAKAKAEATAAKTAPPPVDDKRVRTIVPAKPRPGPSWTDDRVGDILLGGAIAAVAVGAVVFYEGNSKVDDSTSAATTAQYKSRLHTGQTDQAIGLITAGGGALLLVGAIVHYAVAGHHARSEHAAIDVTPTRGGFAVALSRRF